MIHRTPFFVPWFYPSMQWRVKTSAKEVFLTFDDGPVPGPTDFVVDTLSQYNAKATFFTIGDNARKHIKVLEKVVHDGHVVANHTFNHLKGWATDVDSYVANIKKCDEELESYGIKKSMLFRPPYGRIRRSQIAALNEYKIIMWDVLTYDYNNSLSAEKCLKGSINAVRPGSIIVFHDSYRAERNMTYALPRMLDHLRNEGYTFRSL